MPLFNRIVFVDLEADNKDYTKAQITQIAMVGVINDEIVDTLEMKIEFDVSKSEEEALEVGHYDAELWDKEAIPFKKAIKKIDKFLKKYKWVTRVGKKSGKPYKKTIMGGHNIFGFDAPLLIRYYDELDAFYPFDYAVGYDTLAEMKNLQAKSGIVHRHINLTSLCERYGLVNEQAHNAIEDAKVNVAIAFKIEEEVRKFYNPVEVSEKDFVVTDEISI